jgi:hypothetical protein
MKIVEGMKFLTRRRFYDLALAPRYVSPARRAFSSGLAPFSPNIVPILFSTRDSRGKTNAISRISWRADARGEEGSVTLAVLLAYTS